MSRKILNNTVVIRNLEIWPPIALAPMVGLTHSAFRSLVQKEGGVGLLFTEMLAAKRLPHDNPRFSPLLMRSGDERPLIYQVIVADPEHIKPAVVKIHTLDPQGIDLNLGCPAPVQKRQGAGATLAKNRHLLCSILKLFRDNTVLPLSVKIRLGEEPDVTRLRSFCRMLEAEGVDLITVHARLSGEKFCRKPRWSMIGEVKDSVSIPVFANGGIFSSDDARKCLALSAADGLMVGRGAAVKPWLCREIAEEIYEVSVKSQQKEHSEVFFEFIDLLDERFSPERRLGRLKQFAHYFSASLTFGHQLATGIQTSSSMDQARTRAGEFFTNTRGEEND